MPAFILGFTCFFKGIAFSMTRFLGWYLIPILLWLLLIVALSLKLSDWLLPVLYDFIQLHTGLNLAQTGLDGGWVNVFKAGLNIAAVLLIKAMLWYVMGRYMKYIVIIILSPLFAYLSEKTDGLLSGRTFPFVLSKFLKDVLRGIGISLRNMLLETLMVLAGCVICLFIPILSPLVALLLFLLNSYFMAFNFFDYVAERNGMSVGKSVRYMRNNRFALLGFGFAYNLIAFIPFLDWVLAPIGASVGAVIADASFPEGRRADTFVN
jgi:CysZ protein